MYNQCTEQIEKNVKEVLGLEIHFEPRAKQMQLLSNTMNQTMEGKAKTLSKDYKEEEKNNA